MPRSCWWAAEHLIVVPVRWHFFDYGIRNQCDDIGTQKIDCPFIDHNISFHISPLCPRLRRTRTVCSSFCSSWDSFPWLPTGFWTCLHRSSTSPSPSSSAQSSLVSTHGSPDWRLVRAVSKWCADAHPSISCTQEVHTLKTSFAHSSQKTGITHQAHSRQGAVVVWYPVLVMYLISTGCGILSLVVG